MANVVSTPRPRKARRRIGFIIVLGLSLAMAFMGADWFPRVFGPLDYLGIPYPHVLRFTGIVMPALIIAVWVVCRRSEVATGVALFLAIGVMCAVLRWVDAQPARIPLRKWVDGVELRAAEQRLGFKITETGSQHGDFLLVARGNEQAAIDEVKRLGILRP